MYRSFRSLTQKVVFCPVTSLIRLSRLYVREWDRGRKERTFVLRKSYMIPNRQQQRARGFKNAKQCFHATTIKKAKKRQTMTYMPNTIFSCQTTKKRPNFWNLALKMPTWQPWKAYAVTYSMQCERWISFPLWRNNRVRAKAESLQPWLTECTATQP